jgi:VWFA-related protein
MQRSESLTLPRKRSLFQLFILIAPMIWCVSALSAQQSVSQFPPPPPPAEQNPSAAATLRVTSRLVQVEVIAQDKDGNPVTDLTKGDFTIYDKGQQQQIALFGQPTRSISIPGASPTSEPNFFSNRVQKNSAGANSVTVILMDAVNTRFHDLAYVRARVIAFLNELRPEDQVALYLLTPSKLYTLHDFTNDSATLIRMMGASRTDSNGGKSAPPDAETKRMNKTISDAFAESNYFYKGGRMGVVENTAQAMNKIARNVANIPGRKSLVWISGGFPLYIGERDPIGARFERHDYSPLISGTAKMLANADVAVYPVDARGLWAPPGGRGYILPNFDSMIMIANGTGGHAFYNTNDITGSIRKAIDDSVASYTLAYYPTNNNWDYSFRSIAVKTSRKGLQLRYRTGYYAIPDSNDGNGMRDQRISDAIRSPIQLMDLGLEVRADLAPSSDGREVTVQVRIDPAQMHFEKSGERWTDSIDVVWAGISADGRVLDKDADRIALHPEQNEYDEIQRTGLSFTEHIRLQNRPAEIRLVVRDAGTGAIGSVTIPLSSLANKTNAAAPPK